jgi:hypothetical protein
MAYGPITGTRRVFAAVAAAVAMVTVMAWDEGLELPVDAEHPLNKHFPKEVEFMKGLRPARSDRLMVTQKARGEKRRARRDVGENSVSGEESPITNLQSPTAEIGD